MAKAIEDIEGIGPSYGQKLRSTGVTTTDALLESCATKKGRQELSEKTGLSETLILKWVNMADLFRIKGVARQYAELLESAGVDTVREFRNRNADNLAAKMAEINQQKQICKQPPSAQVVAAWVTQAKELPPMVEH